MNPTDPGQYRHRFTLLAPSWTTDAVGQRIGTFTAAGTVTASLRPLNAREVARNRIATVETTHEIRTRHRTDVTTDHRLQLGARVFEITGVQDVEERRAELLISAVERG